MYSRNRLLIIPKSFDNTFCLCTREHEIDEELATPSRNHIKFPNVTKKKQPSEQPSSKEKVLMKKRNLEVGDASRKKTYVKPTVGIDKVSGATKQGVSLSKGVGKVTGVDSSKKKKLIGISRKPLSKTSSMVKSTQDKSTPSLGISLYNLYHPGSEPSEENAAADGEHGRTSTKSVASKASSLPPLDADSERR